MTLLRAREGWTQEAIATGEDMSDGAIALILQEFPELGKLAKPAQTLATYAEPEWTPPIYLNRLADRAPISTIVETFCPLRTTPLKRMCIHAQLQF
jgi:transcriptional regulator with XRE-family HTH domain